MNQEDDIRWIQRFSHFKKAFAQLDDAVKLATERPLSKLETQGLIQAFEFTHELAWKTLKDFWRVEAIRNCMVRKMLVEWHSNPG